MKMHKIYSEVIEGKALSQFFDAMKMDFAVQGALMPDAHAGYSLPIGAVVATDGVIVPAWVGYDIGCGVAAIPTTFNKADVEANKKAIFDQIYRDVPVGFAHNKGSMDWTYDGDLTDVAKGVLSAGGLHQLGTLGGGNHFIEIGYDETDKVWIVIHSGSRNVGHKLATHYMKLASGDGKAREGHFGLRVDTPVGQDYIMDLKFGLAFALQNRKMIAMRTSDAMSRHISGAAIYSELINRNHNHAEMKDGRWIHRKGATHAEDGMMGVIPGNMRDGSFIVKGKGNPESLYSSSHGAGRVLGRNEAKEKLSMDEFRATMGDHGIQALVTNATLDESPMAYKNIFDVMEMQSDLVEVVCHVTPMINIKG